MSLPYSNIEEKCETAAARHLNGIVASRLVGVTVRAGLDNATLPLPNVVCLATGAEEHIYASGNYVVDLSVEIQSSIADSTPSQHSARVAAVRDEFMNDWVGASLSNQGVTDFSAVGVVTQRESRQINDDHWTTIIPMNIYCRPS